MNYLKKIFAIQWHITHHRTICFTLLYVLSVSAAFADKFAYIPVLKQNGLIYVVNISSYIPEVVSEISISYPTGVAINSDGSKVYVSQRFENREGTISIIDAHKNVIMDTRIEGIDLVQPASLIYHPNSNSLFVTHNNGVTKIELDSEGMPTGQNTKIIAKYNSGEIDYMGDLIFTTGTQYSSEDKPLDSGITMFSAYTTRDIIADVSTENIGSIGLSVDSNNSKVYVTNRTEDSITVYRATNDSLTYEETIQLEEGSGPYGVTFDSQNDRLYVANSATSGGIQDEIKKDKNGYSVGGNLSSIELEIDPKTVDYYKLNTTEYRYATDSSLHPLAVNYDTDSRELIVIKDLWLSLNGGMYLSVIPNSLTGLRVEDEIHIYLGNNGKTQFSGRFLGPECKLCPKGDSVNTTLPVRRSGVAPILLTILFSLFYFIRRFEKTISHS